MEVRDPSGRTWRVERRLIQLPRWRGFGRPHVDPVDGVVASSGGGGLEGVVFGLAVVTLLVLSVAFVWPLLVLVAELALAGLLLVGRLLLGRWMVIAETTGQRRTWHTRGRRESKRFAANIATTLGSGASLPVESSFESTLQPPEEIELSTPERTGHVRVIRR